MLHGRAEWGVWGFDSEREAFLQREGDSDSTRSQIELHQTQKLGSKVLHSGGVVWSLVCEALGHGKVEF